MYDIDYEINKYIDEQKNHNINAGILSYDFKL